MTIDIEPTKTALNQANSLLATLESGEQTSYDTEYGPQIMETWTRGDYHIRRYITAGNVSRVVAFTSPLTDKIDLEIFPPINNALVGTLTLVGQSLQKDSWALTEEEAVSHYQRRLAELVTG